MVEASPKVCRVLLCLARNNWVWNLCKVWVMCFSYSTHLERNCQPSCPEGWSSEARGLSYQHEYEEGQPWPCGMGMWETGLPTSMKQTTWPRKSKDWHHPKTTQKGGLKAQIGGTQRVFWRLLGRGCSTKAVTLALVAAFLILQLLSGMSPLH